MRAFPLLFVFIVSIAHSIPQKPPSSIRCQCSTSKGGIKCYGDFCEVYSNATHVAACAVVKQEHENGRMSQLMACVRVSERADEGFCSFDVKRNATKCWCTGDDYCNIDLVDRIRGKRLSDEESEEEEEDDFTVETNTEFNENNNNIDDDTDEIEQQNLVPQIVDAVDMRKPVETKALTPEEENIPVWRRTGTDYRPRTPPPMPGQAPIIPPTATTSTITTTTTTTTTTSPPTTTTTTAMSYEEQLRQYEERRRQIELQRENELRRRAEVERKRLEERRNLESQYEAKKRFEEERRPWPVVPVVTTTPTTTMTTTVPLTTTTTTTVPPPTTKSTTTSTTTTTAAPQRFPSIVEKSEKQETKSDRSSYWRNWKRPQHRPFDLNPTISVEKVSAIVYPPKQFVKATTSTSSTSTTTSTTTTTTTTTTPAPTTTTTRATTTTTQPIIYPPPGFRKASKAPSSTPTTTTPFPTTTESAYNLPISDDEDVNEDGIDLNGHNRKMIEMPRIEPDSSDEEVVMYTPKPPPRTSSPTPSVRTPAKKLDEYKKLLEPASSRSSSIIIPSIVSLIILFLF